MPGTRPLFDPMREPTEEGYRLCDQVCGGTIPGCPVCRYETRIARQRIMAAADEEVRGIKAGAAVWTWDGVARR